MKSISKISFTIFTLLILSIFSFLVFQFSLANVYAAGILGKLAKELMGEAIQTGIDTGAEITEGYDSSVRLFSEPKQASKDTIQVNLINRYKDSCVDRANSTEFNSIQDSQLNNISEMYYRGISLVDSGKCNEALDYFDKVLAIEPYDADAWYEKGRTLYMLERYDEALVANNQSIMLNPIYPDVWTNRGTTLLTLGEYDEAFKDMNKSLQLDPNYVPALLNKAIILTVLEKYASSIPYYNQYLSQFPNDVYAITGKGIALLGLEMMDKAIDTFNIGIESDPSFPLPAKFKERILNEMKEDN